MNPNEPLNIVLYSGGALFLGLTGLLMVGCFIGIQSHFRRWFSASLFPLILLAMALSAVFAGRDLSYADTDMTLLVASETTTVTWILRAITLLVLGVCAARIFSSLQAMEGPGRQGYALFLAFLFFYVTNIVLNNVLGAKPYFDQKVIYPLLVFLTLFLSRGDEKQVALQTAKWGMFFFVLLSLGAAAVAPGMALQPAYYDGIVSQLDFRLWGLGSHPNSMAPLALSFLLLSIYLPFRSRWLHYLALGSALLVILLSQSKTTWVTTLITLAVIYWARFRYANTDPRTPHSPHSLRRLSTPIFIALIGIALVIAYLVVTQRIESASMAQREAISTLSGRAEIWQVAIKTWQANPLFGYGSSAWDDEFRTRIGMGFAYTAHNQFLQTLSEAGLVGLSGLVIYLVVLLRLAVLATPETRGFSLALFIVLLGRCYTEAPFTMTNMFTGEVLMHMLLFRLLLPLQAKQAYWAPAQQMSQFQMK